MPKGRWQNENTRIEERGEIRGGSEIQVAKLEEAQERVDIVENTVRKTGNRNKQIKLKNGIEIHN